MSSWAFTSRRAVSNAPPRTLAVISSYVSMVSSYERSNPVAAKYTKHSLGVDRPSGLALLGSAAEETAIDADQSLLLLVGQLIVEPDRLQYGARLFGCLVQQAGTSVERFGGDLEGGGQALHHLRRAPGQAGADL